MPSTSVVITTWTAERWKQLTEAVAAVQAQTAPATEVIVVVDHAPALEERVRQSFRDVIVVSNGERRGASGAKNAGISAARGEFIAFLDDDATPEPDWLAYLFAPFADARVLGVGGMAIPAWDSGNVPWFPEEFYWVVGCSYAGLPEHATPVRNVIGCNMAFRAEPLRALGGFRHELGRVKADPLGGEETEFCIRLTQRWPDSVLLYEPRARVHHHVPTARSSWRYFRQRCYAEGLSKAHVTRLVGVRAGLESERHHSVAVLPGAALRAVTRGVLQRDAGAVARSGAIVAGLGITVAGYGIGAVTKRLSHGIRAPLADGNPPPAMPNVSERVR